MLSAILRKELITYAGDRAGLFQLLVSPLITITLFSFLLANPGFDGMRVAVADQAANAASAAAIERLEEAGLAPAVTSAQSMDRSLTHGSILAGVVIPAGYPGEPVRIHLSPAQAGAAKSLGHLLAGALAAGTAESERTPGFGSGPPLAAVEVAWGTNATPGREANTAAAGYIILTLFFIVVNLGRSLLSEQEAGVFRRLQGTPVTGPTLFLGKWLPAWLISFVQAWFFVTYAHFVLKLDVGPAATVIPATTAITACASALGLWVGAYARTENQVTAIGVGLSLSLAALGGCFAPLYLLPAWLQQAAWVIPQHWALVALQQGIAYESGFLGVLPYLSVLVAFTAAFMLLGARQFGLVLRRG